MKLQLLVPHWQESWKDIQPLLDSVEIQQGIPFNEVGMIIVYDGPDAKPIKFKRKYSFEIKEVHAEEKIGVSAARNLALDNATADYVMFCDADDMFHNALGLFAIFSEMSNPFDLLIDQFVEEIKRNGELTYMMHERDFTFVHGKVYNRQFLVDNNLRFNPKLTLHEDGYFNILVAQMCKTYRYQALPYYLWRWRDSSVCRNEPDFVYKTFDKFIESGDAVADEFERRGMNEVARMNVCSSLIGYYFQMNNEKWLGHEFDEMRLKVGKVFHDWLVKWERYWRTMDKKVIDEIFSTPKYSKTKRPPNAERIIKDWAKSFLK